MATNAMGDGVANAIYNEIEPFAAAWLEQLAERGHIGPGRVDRRSVADLSPDDVAGPGQRHFFAGIGGWSYALRLAGVADDADVWTGSCPCQPFSVAGKGAGVDDPRHLWPAWFRLIRECRPSTIFGEQVAGRAGLEWLDAVRSDMEGCGYAFGSAVLTAAGVGAPHRRERLYFVAHADKGIVAHADEGKRRRVADREGGIVHRPPARRIKIDGEPEPSGQICRVAVGHADGRRCEGERVGELRADGDASRRRDADGCGVVVDADSARREGQGSASRRSRMSGGMGDAGIDRDRQHDRELPRHEGQHEERGPYSDHASVDPSAARDPWRGCEWIPCSDGKSRPAQPGTFPLAHGVPGRVGMLRGYGNAIVPQVAAAFIQAAWEMT